MSERIRETAKALLHTYDECSLPGIIWAPMEALRAALARPVWVPVEELDAATEHFGWWYGPTHYRSRPVYLWPFSAANDGFTHFAPCEPPAPPEEP